MNMRMWAIVADCDEEWLKKLRSVGTRSSIEAPGNGLGVVGCESGEKAIKSFLAARALGVPPPDFVAVGCAMMDDPKSKQFFEMLSEERIPIYLIPADDSGDMEKLRDKGVPVISRREMEEGAVVIFSCCTQQGHDRGNNEDPA